MKRFFFKTTSLILILTYICNLCLYDLSFAAQAPSSASSPKGASGAQNSSAPVKSDTDNPAADTPADNPQPTSSSSSGAGSPPAVQITGTGFNLAALQALQTDPFTGRANFSLPIEVPPGRRGIQPNLRLTYSSGAGNGILGVGWALELGAIERSTKKGVPTYNDSTDTFIFTSSGASSELVSIGSNEYRAKIEGAFMKFLFTGSSWIVTDKTGTKFYFGQTFDSQQNEGSKVFKWCLDKVIDRQGNYLTLTYTKQANQLYPKTIAWTGNEKTNLLPSFSVEFQTESRPDTQVSFRSGFYVVTEYRINKIEIFDNRDVSYPKLIRSYSLGYSTSGANGTNRSLLTQVTQSAADGITLPAITFDYQPFSLGWTEIANKLPGDTDFDGSTRVVDVNNDGFPDILQYDGTIRKTYLGQANAHWQETSFWQLPGGLNLRDSGVQFLDINADGWQDLVVHNHSAGRSLGKYAYVNNKLNGWNEDGNSAALLPDEVYFLEDGQYSGWLGIDINADGLTDFIRKKGNEKSCFINTGTGFRRDANWDMPQGDIANGSTQFADFNADGLIDFFIHPGTVYINNGYNWGGARAAEFDLSQLQDIPQESVQVLDVNSDGLADVVVKDANYSKTFIKPGNYRAPWQERPELRLPDGNFANFGTRVTDAQGRLVLDILVKRDGNRIWVNNNPILPELLTRISNGLGGEVEIKYKPSTEFENTTNGKSDLSFPVYVVDTVTTRDKVNPDNPDIISRYEYQKGLFDFTEREFRGFGLVKTIDNQGNYSETKFYQDDFYKGRPFWQETKDVSGKTYTQQETEWQRTQPYLFQGVPEIHFPRVFGQSNYTCDADPKKSSTYFEEYDAYGNPKKVISLGNQTPSKAQKTEYTYNTADYIVATPKRTSLLDNQSNVVSEKRFYYDNSLSMETPPQKGLLTKEESPLYNPLTGLSTVVSTRYAYDTTFGNLETTTNTLEQTTSTTYDTSSLRSLAVTVTNPKTQTVKAVYYGVNESGSDAIIGRGLFGQVKSQEDPNRVRTYNVYDSLGRLIKVIGPNDTESSPGVIYEYDLTIQPIKVTQKTKVREGEYLTSYSFYDGLGRVIESKSPAESDPQTGSPRQIVSGVVRYDAKGQVVKKYLPCFVAESPNYVTPDYTQAHSTFTYDTLGRLTQTINPDATYSTAIYSDWETTFIDENGHQKKESKNAYGQMVRIEEYSGADGRSPNNYPYQAYSLYSTTLYEYDTLGNLTKITDNQANITQIWYDSQGRKVKMSDPDMGEWTYEYDNLGNLKKQTDAKGQVLEFNYDSLNRLTGKLANGQTIVTYSYDDTFKPYSTGRLSKITDTSGSTEFFYDNQGREIKSIKTVNGSGSYTFERTYDDLDRLVTLKYPDGEVVTYEYNPQGITSIQGQSAAGGLSLTYVSNIDYSPTGQLTKIQCGNGTQTNYTYDPRTLRLNQLITYNSQLQTIQNLSYQFDESGNIKQLDDVKNTATQTFKYDCLSRLIQAQGRYGSFNYGYDSIGNMTSKEGVDLVYGKGQTAAGGLSLPHAVTQYGSTLIDYDANGNLIKKGNLDLTYDSENRLTKVEDKSYLQPTTYNLPLTPGWNFFSLPVIPADLKITSVLGSLTAKDTYTKLLLHNDGAAGSPTLTDAAGKGVSVYGDVQLDDLGVDNKFSQSARFDGNSDYLSLADNADWDFGKGDFSIDFWLRFNALPLDGSNMNVINQYLGIDRAFQLYIERSGVYYFLTWQHTTDGTSSTQATYQNIMTLSANTWYHFALVRSGNTLKAYKDGLYMGTTFDMSGVTIFDSTQALTIGADNTGRASDFNGWLDEIRVSKGIARWTGDHFTLPTQAYSLDEQISGSVITQVSRFNPAAKKFEHFVNNPKYNQFDSFEYGKGYQLYLAGTSNVTLTLQGLIPQGTLPVALKSGYNLIPCPKTKETSVEAALLPLKLGVDYDKVYHYNKDSSLFEIYNSTQQEFSHLKPGESYYLSCLKDTTWNIDHTQPITTFVYDGDGGRVKKIVGSNSTTYIGNLYEIDSSGEIRKHIFSGANRVCTLTHNSSLLTSHFYHSDHLGSSNLITDASGNQVALTEFTPYGSISKQTGTYDPKHKFTGKELDSSTELYFYGARYYDPELGRFISADSIVQAPYDPQSLNRYTYARNNPINLIDPTGHKWSWGKFWKSFAGVFVAVVATLVLGPGGALAWYGWTMASAIGGALGGALTGGLEGGWKGALIGAAIGGITGGIGGWAYGGGHTFVMAGMFAAGTGYAAATNSWDSYAGAFVGGIAGAAVGSGINSAFKPNNSNPKSFGKPTNGTNDGNANKALIVDKGKATSGDSIIDDPAVRAEMQKAYAESYGPGQTEMHEQGGWVTQDQNGKYSVQRWPRGTSDEIYASPMPSNTVADFHTHPQDPYHSFGYFHRPSPTDYTSARMGSSYGLSHYMVDQQGIISYTPSGNINNLGTGTYKEVWRW